MKESIKQKENISKVQEKTLDESLATLAEAFSTKSVIIRGLTTGLFTAVGATVGFALVFYFFVTLWSGLKGVPIIKQFMEATGLDQVVEYVIDQRDKPIIDTEVTDQYTYETEQSSGEDSKYDLEMQN